MDSMARSGSTSPLPSNREAAEGAREREFYKYYEPFYHVMSNYTPTEAQSSFDQALAAFAQLGALRLDVRRVLISFFDRKHEYILAEATRTLSLHSNKSRLPEDALYLGTGVHDRPATLCGHTHESALDDQGRSSPGDHLTDVMTRPEDEEANAQYSKIPPNTRFYAGVPITTPNGHHIGTYAIYDDRQRHGLDDDEIQFMQEMAMTVMSHIDLVRGKEEHRRAAQMVAGLGTFIEGKANFEGWFPGGTQDVESGNIESTGGAVGAQGLFAPMESLGDASEAVRQSKRTDESHDVAQAEREESSQHEHREKVQAKHKAAGYGHGGGHVKDHRKDDRKDSPPRERQENAQAKDWQKSSSSLHERQENAQVGKKDLGPGQGDDDQEDNTHSSDKPHEDWTTAPSKSRSPDQSRDSPESQAGLQHHLIPSSIRSTFSRAANIIYKSIDVHGAAFFDASVGTFGGLVSNSPQGSAGHTVKLRSDKEEEEDTNSHGDEPRSDQSNSNKNCQVLGYATPDGNSIGARTVSNNRFPLTERFLQSLLKNYPQGKIFNFDPGREQKPRSAQPPEASEVPEDFGEQIYPPDPPLDDPAQQESRRRSRQSDLRHLAKTFPGVCSLAFIPFWDSHRQRWFAAAFTWSNSPVRLLHQDSELSFLSAFGQSIMAEVVRLDTAMADKAKSDLLGSISHELRSPLHGVLGSAECLEETQLDSLQQGLVHSIETCGRTLLVLSSVILITLQQTMRDRRPIPDKKSDTIDHLLDFSKMNHFGERSGTQQLDESRNVWKDGLKTSSGGMANMESDVDVSNITEEAVETVFAGYDYTKVTPTQRNERAELQTPSGLNQALKRGSEKGGEVKVILEVATTGDAGWMMRLKAGAWRRIVMNIAGNSLKYTERGFVHIKLEAKPLQGRKQNRSRVILTVTDTGKGMSQEYLNTKLFTPFVQEDPLNIGTGLGLSIVRQIVSSMGGEITVSSKQGSGTRIQIEIVMLYAPSAQPDWESGNIPAPHTLIGKTKGLNAVFFDTEETDTRLDLLSRFAELDLGREDAEGLFVSGLSRSLNDWFGIKIRTEKSIGLDTDADVLVTTERAMVKLTEQDSLAIKPQPDKLILVLCNSVSSARRDKAAHQALQRSQHVEFLPQPVGPRKLARALAFFLDRRETSSTLSRSRSETSKRRASSHDLRESETIREPGHIILPENQNTNDQADRYPESMDVDTPKDEKIVLETALSAPAQQRTAQAKSSSLATTSKGALHLLLVDDNKVNLQLLERFMKTKHHSFVSAEDGVEAVEAYKSTVPASRPPNESDSSETKPTPTEFDFVLMDISMPRMDGLEATRQIRALERTHGLKGTTVIALTGLASASAQQEAFSSGVNLFLTKPVKLKELHQMLEKRKKEKGQ